MNRPIAILFLLLQLMTNTELCQVLKIPVLISHFTEHRALNDNLSFTGFLRMHYFNGDPQNGDYDRDMQLPFKTNSCAQVMSQNHSVYMISQNMVLVIIARELSKNYSKHYSVWIPSGDLNDIFQPPRFS